VRRIGDELGRELIRLGPQGAIGDVVAAWPEAVGAAIARNAWPARIARDRTLHVAAASSAWAFELQQLAPSILDKLRAALPESAAPAALRFAPGPLPASSSPSAAAGPTSSRESLELTPEEKELGEHIASGIAEKGLREVVARAAAASLARRSA
jgi:hypothetical protein